MSCWRTGSWRRDGYCRGVCQEEAGEREEIRRRRAPAASDLGARAKRHTGNACDVSRRHNLRVILPPDAPTQSLPSLHLLRPNVRGRPQLCAQLLGERYCHTYTEICCLSAFVSSILPAFHLSEKPIRSPTCCGSSPGRRRRYNGGPQGSQASLIVEPWRHRPLLPKLAWQIRRHTARTWSGNATTRAT